MQTAFITFGIVLVAVSGALAKKEPAFRDG